jgi:hypothetical protein
MTQNSKNLIIIKKIKRKQKYGAIILNMKNPQEKKQKIFYNSIKPIKYYKIYYRIIVNGFRI